MNFTIVPSPFIRYPFFNNSFSILNFIFSYSNCSSLVKVFSLTPYTIVFKSSPAGAEIITFFAPAFI